MLDGLAQDPDPYPTYAALRDRGVHVHDDGRWVVARARDVDVVLGSPGARVGYVAPAGDPGAAVQATMARFSDGADHDRRRALATARLAGIAPARLRSTAHAMAVALLATSDSDGDVTVEVMGLLARQLPIAALAVELGADPELVVPVTRELALALAPPIGTPRGDVAGLAGQLGRLVSGHRGDVVAAGAQVGRLVDGPAAGIDDEATVNVVALLFQATDATAGLIGNTVVAASGGRFAPADSDALVGETNRFDPPVQLTTRVAAEPVEVGGTTIPADGRIVVLLAAAGRDPDLVDRPDRFDPGRRPAADGFGFGAGPRPCPGDTHALALAAGVVEALLERGATLAEPSIAYEPRANLRIPTRLTVRLT